MILSLNSKLLSLCNCENLSKNNKNLLFYWWVFLELRKKLGTRSFGWTRDISTGFRNCDAATTGVALSSMECSH